jgi:TolB-like protein/tetratricopeptide (TPR) repeat protein
MASQPQRSLAEQKRRRVYRASAAYVVVAAGAIGIAAAALPSEIWERLQLPVVVAALLGLPIVLVLAWVLGSKSGQVSSEAPAPVLARPKRAPRTSILVLPLDNISPNPADAYLSDGLTAGIITALSHLQALRVISRSSAMVLKETKKDVPTLGRYLRVQYVLKGSVRKAGNELRITAQLFDAGDDAPLWAEQYGGVLDDVLGMQEQVSRGVVNALDLILNPGESESLGKRPVGGSRAYDCFLKARHEIDQSTRKSLEAGIGTLRHGLARFPDDPLLLATLGEAYFARYDWGIAREDWVLDRAEELARRALSSDPASAQGRKLLGHVERYRGSVARACQHFLEAYRADSTDTGILLHSAMLLSEVGWGDLAARFYRRLLEADPLTPFNYLMAGLGQVFRGRPRSGMELMREFRSRAPTVTVPMSGSLAVGYCLAGQKGEALKEVDRALAGDPDPIHDWFLRFIRHACRGEVEAAVDVLDPMNKAVAWDDADLPLILPAFFAQMRRRAETLEWMARALERGLINYPFFAQHGAFASLRPDPRFQEILGAIRQEWERSPIPRMVSKWDRGRNAVPAPPRPS